MPPLLELLIDARRQEKRIAGHAHIKQWGGRFIVPIPDPVVEG